MASPFSPETREATLAALPAAALDVLVIGGGITGAGVARDAALEREPTLDGTRRHGAATFVEYLTCDARLVLETVLGAHAAGALCVNHVEATEIEGSEVALRDTLTGRALHARSAVVVNAA